MRSFSRLLASVKPVKYLEPSSPTGLTGLFTHPAPRSALLFLYNTTLDNLKTIPESSVYRQSTEALTKHRLNIVESVKPVDYDAWLERSRKLLEQHPKLYEESINTTGDGMRSPLAVKRGGQTFVAVEIDSTDPREIEWDGEEDVGPALEGPRSQEDKDKDVGHIIRQQTQARSGDEVRWEPEPQLNADQYVKPPRSTRLNSNCLRLSFSCVGRGSSG